MSAHVYLHIDRLVIDESLLGDGGREALAVAVQSELTRLLGQAGTCGWRSAAVSSLQADAIHVLPGGGASVLGAQIAGAVNSSVMQELHASPASTNQGESSR